MKKKLVVLLAVIMVLAVVSLPAAATPPDTTVSGIWCYGYLEEGEHKIAGGNEFYDLDSTDAWIGTFEGFSISEGRVQEHPSGYTILKTNTVLDPITVAGKTGTLEMNVNGWMPTGGPYSEYEGLWVITGGTGELAGLHGQGTWGGVAFGHPECLAIDPEFIAWVPYKGSIHFDP